ncbi:uncharacterized protein JCM6883_004765 [Sporobolomyces salmoneus]|uniref:uncharacterized protein n=1 Tax=Sporobolomyces salmoneus TaxID=183962 RepID=UPI00317D17EE
MAVGKNKRLSKGKKGIKKRVVDPFTRKDWYDLKAPSMFDTRNIGKTLVNRSSGLKNANDSLKGRIFELSLADLNKDDENTFRKVKLRVDEVQGKNCLTNFHGMDFTSDKLRSLVRKWQTLIEAHSDVKTTDGYLVRLFTIGFTKRRPNQVKKTTYAKSAQIREIRGKMFEIIQREATSCDLKQLVHKLVPEVIGREIEKASQGIYPLQNCYVRKVKILKAPKYDIGKLLELHGESTTEETGTKVVKGDFVEPPVLASVCRSDMTDVPPTKPGARRPPKLDLRAFQSAAAPTSSSRRLCPRSLIDSHIHLWTKQQLDNGQMVWPTQEGGLEQLRGAHEMTNYQSITSEGIKQFAKGQSQFDGVVFVQAEVKHDDEDADGSKGGWQASIEEVEIVCAQALGSGLNVVALVPWAPVHQGSQAIELYLSQLLSQPSLKAYEEKLGYPPIKSFRYLLQDSPKGFFQTEKFLDGLDFLGQKGYAFDMTLDVTHKETGGPLILDDAVDAISKVRELQKEKGYETKFILDHFAKPDLTVDATVPPSPFQTAYISSLFALALLPNVYLKLSALLDSADKATVQDAFRDYGDGNSTRGKRKGTAYETLLGRIRSYLEPSIEAFGESRILVGSDWPMFRASLLSSSTPTFPASPDEGENTEALAWSFEMDLYLDCLVEIGLEGESLDNIFGANAKAAYGLQ